MDIVGDTVNSIADKFWYVGWRNSKRMFGMFMCEYQGISVYSSEYLINN